MPKYPAAVTDATIATSDITTNNASTSKHGWIKKLDNTATHFMDGTGVWSTPAGEAVATSVIFDAKGDLAVGTGADTAVKLTVGTNTYLLTADSAQTTGLRWQNIGWTEVTKASDESVTSSTTLQADDELLFTAASTSVYEIEIVAIYANAAGATPDFKCLPYEDATARGAWSAFAYEGFGTTDNNTGAAGLTNSAASAAAWGTAVANRVVKIMAWHVGGGGSFKLYWAQNTSDATATVVRAGSILRYRKIL